MTVMNKKQGEMTEFQKQKLNLKIGEETTLDSYSRIPIENFGKNILSKLGYSRES